MIRSPCFYFFRPRFRLFLLTWFKLFYFLPSSLNLSDWDINDYLWKNQAKSTVSFILNMYFYKYDLEIIPLMPHETKNIYNFSNRILFHACFLVKKISLVFLWRTAHCVAAICYGESRQMMEVLWIHDQLSTLSKPTCY